MRRFRQIETASFSVFSAVKLRNLAVRLVWPGLKSDISVDIAVKRLVCHAKLLELACIQ